MRPEPLLAAIGALLLGGCATTGGDPPGAPPEPPAPLASKVGPEDFRISPADVAQGAEPRATPEPIAPPPETPEPRGRAPADTGQLVDGSGEPASPPQEPPPGDAGKEGGEGEDGDGPRLDVLGGSGPPAGVAESDEPALLERLRNGPDRSEALRKLLALYLSKGDPIRAHELVTTNSEQVDEADVESLYLLAILFDRLGEEARSKEYAEKAVALQGGTRALRVVKTSFARRESQGARATYRPATYQSFYANDLVHIWLELADWGVEDTGSGYRVRQSISLRLVDGAGKERPLAPRSNEFVVDKPFPQRPRELHHTLRNLRLPYDLEPGKYAFEIELTDHAKKGAGATAATKIDFEVK